MSTYHVFSLYKVQTGKTNLMLLEVRIEVSFGEVGSDWLGYKGGFWSARKKVCFLVWVLVYMGVFTHYNAPNCTIMICANFCYACYTSKKFTKKVY